MVPEKRFRKTAAQMSVNYDSFTHASTLIHCLQGGAFLLLGAAEVYLLKQPGRKAGFVGALALLLAGVLGFIVILAVPGGWNFGGLAGALAARRGFHIFVAFSCLFAAAGLSRLMQLTAPAGGRWQAAFLVFLAAIGVLYFMLAWRVNAEALRTVLLPHAAIGAALLLAVGAKAFNSFSGRRALQLCWAALLLVTGLQLLAYREAEAAFGPHLVTLEAGPLQPEPAPATIKNVPTAAKERSGN